MSDHTDGATFIVHRLHRLTENETDYQLTLDDLADEIIRREARLAETFEPRARADLADEIANRVDQLGPLLARLDATRQEIALAESLLAL